MYKVLIIDDERNIRENLKSLIPWEDLGFMICGEADNGDEGLRLHNELIPHLVLVDIRMPGLNGLDMIKAMKKQNELIKILIVTGYSQFEYAKQAIECGVDGYILKPVDEDELKKKVLASKVDLMRKAEEIELVEKSRHTVIDQFLTGLIKGEGTNTEDMDSHFLEKLFAWKSYQLFLVEPEQGSLVTQKQKQQMKDLIHHTMIGIHPGYVLELDGIIAGLIKKRITSSSVKELKELAHSIKTGISTPVTFYIGRYSDNHRDLGAAYKHIKKVMSKRFFYRTGEIVFTSHLAGKQKPGKSKFSEADLIDQLYMAIDLNKEKELVKILDELHEKIMYSGQEEDAVKTKYMGLLYTISKRVAENRPDMKYLVSDYDKIIHKIGEVKQIHELYNVIKEKVLTISFEILATRPREEVIQRVIDYIEHHYHTHIKLKNLSELFHYNSAYFGQLFKDTTGHSFNTYVDMVRIDKAKEFLRKGMKVYEAAAQTGFSDVDNFYKKFKRYTGMSPSVYRKKDE